MLKCEVLQDTVLSVCKGSVILVTEKQYELARNVLKPVEIKTEAKAEVVETRTDKAKETKKRK